MCILMALGAIVVQGQDLKIHVDKKGKVGFADSQGNVIIKCQYESAYPFSNGVSIVCKSKSYGMIDMTGKVVLPIKYSNISSWNDLYLIKDGKKMGLASKSGEIVLKAEYSLISKVNCYGKALIAVGGKASPNDKKTYMAGAKYGIIDKNGRILINPEYKGLYEFAFDGTGNYPYYEGKRLVYSYHNTTDTLLTNCSFLGVNKNGFNIADCGIIDGQGKELLKQGLYTYVMEPKGNMVRYYIAKKKETLCGYHDLLTGKSFQATVFKSAIGDIKYWTHGDFSGNIAPVNGSTWSFIDKSGQTLRKGYTLVRHSEQTGLWAAKNSSGTWDVFNESNHDVSPLSGYVDILFPTQKGDKDVFVVKKGIHYGAITRAGDEVVPFEYEEAMANTYDVIPVKKDGKWGAVTANNEMLFPVSYAGFLLPSERNCQHFWVQQSDSLYYHLNISNNKISPSGFKGVSNFKDGIAHVRPDGFIVDGNSINKAQMYAPNKMPIANTGKDKKKTTAPTVTVNPSVFGYLLGTDDTLLFKLPVSTLYVDQVVQKIKARGYRAFTPSEEKGLLLDLTKENRSYNMSDILGEEEWNY